MNIVRHIFTVAVIIFVLLVTFQGISTAKSGDKTYRVSVKVQADDSVESLINSYIRRQLRSINDVVIVDTDAEFVLMVLGIENNGSIAIEYTVLETIHGINFGLKLDLALSDFLEVNFPKMDVHRPWRYKKQFDEILLERAPNLRIYSYGGLKVGSSAYLEKFCRNIVATFDTDSLEPLRSTEQKLSDFYRELQKKTEGKDSSE